MVAEANATNRLRLVSVRYIMTNIATVDFANSRLHERTSYHSSLAMMRLMAFTWKGANSYLAYVGKKYSIHAMGSASSSARFLSMS